MNCKKCGAPLGVNDVFCKMCGERVNAPAQTNNIPNSAYNPGPVAPQKYFQTPPPEKNNNMKYICIIVVVILVIGFGIFAVNKLAGNKKTPSSSSSTSTNPVASTSTYQLKYKNFTFQVPEEYLNEIDDNGLALGDVDNTWIALVDVFEGQYSNLKLRKDKLKQVIEQEGCTVNKIDVKTIDNKEFIVVEILDEGKNSLLGYTKLNTNHIISIEIYNKENTVDYKTMEKLSTIVDSATYTQASASITDFSIPNRNGNITSVLEEEPVEQPVETPVEAPIEGE